MGKGNKMVRHDLLIDGIEDLEAIFPRTDELHLFQDGKMVRRKILWKIEVLPDVADAAFSFLQQAEDAQAVLITDCAQECSVF
jgi:hypothetical protein